MMEEKNDRLTDVAEVKTAGLSIASLILGIISIAFSIFLIGGILAVVGIILGVIHLKNRKLYRTMAVWGVITSLLGLLVSVGMGSLYYRAYRRIRTFVGEAAKDRPAAFSEWQGVRAPDFTVTGLAGERIRLSDLRGRRVVLNFWATWCPPCVREIPHFVRLAEEHGRDELVIVGISSEKADRLSGFVEERKINYQIVSTEDLPEPYKSVRSLPTTFFIDRNGVIQTVYRGYRDYETLKAAALAEDFAGEVLESPRAEDDTDPVAENAVMEPVP